jgi:hypothetical protein
VEKIAGGQFGLGNRTSRTEHDGPILPNAGWISGGKDVSMADDASAVEKLDPPTGLCAPY